MLVCVPGSAGSMSLYGIGEMADSGYPLACETDVNGAITLAILRACNLYEDSEFWLI